MAAAYLTSVLAANGRCRHRVESGGTLGITGNPAAEAAIAVLDQACSVDLRPHRSRGLSREAVEDADTILVMESSHRRYIRTLYPPHHTKVRLLSEFAPRASGVPRGTDIFDPIGMDPEAFGRCFQIMRACLDGFIATLD
ncbi:MAG: hypothetical protein ACE5HU_01265 [Acidobacteriota bacterium]